MAEIDLSNKLSVGTEFVVTTSSVKIDADVTTETGPITIKKGKLQFVPELATVEFKDNLIIMDKEQNNIFSEY